jgi:hypothetical protein
MQLGFVFAKPGAYQFCELGAVGEPAELLWGSRKSLILNDNSPILASKFKPPPVWRLSVERMPSLPSP